jgi:hypothetical protein
VFAPMWNGIASMTFWHEGESLVWRDVEKSSDPQATEQW